MIKFFNELPVSELAKIATLHFNHWRPVNSALTLEGKIEEFTTEYARHSDKLPCGFAMYNARFDKNSGGHDGGCGGDEQTPELVGFCRLKILNLREYPELRPWISSVFVLKPHCGYGARLVSTACDTLKRMGYKEVYVYTDRAPGFYKKLGFEYLREAVKNDGGRAELFRKSLL